ncbi:MAG TPA: monovalent cation/H+ antiporter subunit D [Woeseiaceae bacterium]|nr:monovalent cation/H+ antiporter subunit D [Woeseiaceae bacterium]
MSGLLQHLLVLPIVVPLIAGAAMLLLPESARSARVAIALTSMCVQLATAIALLYLTTDAAPFVWPEGIGVYPIGSWPAPFGIVLVVDRLSALMITLGTTVALAALTYSVARWDRPGQPFHSLFQFLMMGVNGAFLTGDLFNLFVFFEILLAASYGLMLRGLGAKRVRTGLHYIAINLASSFLFLIGVALIYGVAGTLNMADLTGKVAALGTSDRALFDAGAAILGVAFLVKAGSWPLNFWLPGTYAIAIAPVSAVFAIMTKVGIYAVLRVGTLMGDDDAAAAMLGWILFYIGMGTLVAGTIGMLSSQHLARLISFSVIVSSGLLLAALGLGIEELTAPVLFYLLTSVLTTGAFFMLTGMADRARLPVAAAAVDTTPPPRPYYVAFGVGEQDPYSIEEEIGAAIPAAMAFLGLVFVCCVLLVTGLPPLPGFVAKFALLSTALGSAEVGGAPVWALAVAVLVSGLAGVFALTRIGMRLFWSAAARRTPRLRVLEALPVAVLVLLTFGLSAASGPVMMYLEAAARSLHDPATYIRAVLSPQDGTRPGVREP